MDFCTANFKPTKNVTEVFSTFVAGSELRAGCLNLTPTPTPKRCPREKSAAVDQRNTPGPFVVVTCGCEPENANGLSLYVPQVTPGRGSGIQQFQGLFLGSGVCLLRMGLARGGMGHPVLLWAAHMPNGTGTVAVETLRSLNFPWL